MKVKTIREHAYALGLLPLKSLPVGMIHQRESDKWRPYERKNTEVSRETYLCNNKLRRNLQKWQIALALAPLEVRNAAVWYQSNMASLDSGDKQLNEEIYTQRPPYV